MKTIKIIINAFGRFAVGLAIGIGLTSIYVIATEAGAGAGAGPEARPSAGAMATESLRATAADADVGGPTVARERLHVYGRGVQRV